MNMEKINNSILHDWVVNLELKHQAKLLPVLRGCDTEHKKLKPITKMLRWLIGKNFVKKTSYSDDKLLCAKEAARCLTYYGNIESKHWLDHIITAIKTIMEHHPDTYVKHYWTSVFNSMDMFITLPDFVYRLLKERYDLDDKIYKLGEWADKDYNDVTSDQKEQLLIMRRYVTIVDNRIRAYCEDNSLEYDEMLF